MTNYTTKSMNGIITIDDGMGTVISGGQIATDNLALASLECNNIQGTNPSDDIFLYTGTTTGTINIGAGATTSTTTIRTDNIEALTGSTINVGRTTDTLSYRGTNKLNNISCILPNSSVNLFTNLNIATNQNIFYRTIIGSLISIVQLINLSFSNNRIISANTNDTITLFDTLASNGKVNIGSTTSETNTGNLTFKNKRISSSLAGDTVNLFDNITSGIINLGGVSSDVRISGRIGIKDTTFTALEGINAGVSLFSNITTGLISIGGGITTGTLNIGTSQTATGIINLGGVGEVDIGRFRFQNNALKGDISASTLYLFPDFDNNTQTLNIANQLTSTSDPNINIGAPKALTTIGATVFRTVSSVNYIYPSTATAMVIGSSNLSLITATSLDLKTSGSMTLATTGLITVGSSASVNIGPSMTTGNFVNIGGTGANSNSGLKCYTPISVNYGTNWGLPSTNQIGQVIIGSGTANTCDGTVLTKRTITLTAGCYIILGNVQFNLTQAWNVTSISATNNSHDPFFMQYGGNTGYNSGVNLTRPQRVSTGTTQNLYLVCHTAGFSDITGVSFFAMRIA